MQTAILMRTFYFSVLLLFLEGFFKQCWTLSASLSPQYLFWGVYMKIFTAEMRQNRAR